MEETSVSTARKSVSFSGSEWIYKDLPEPPFLVPHGEPGSDKISEGDNDSEVEERRNSGSGENADGDGRNGRSAGRQSERETEKPTRVSNKDSSTSAGRTSTTSDGALVGIRTLRNSCKQAEDIKMGFTLTDQFDGTSQTRSSIVAEMGRATPTRLVFIRLSHGKCLSYSQSVACLLTFLFMWAEADAQSNVQRGRPKTMDAIDHILFHGEVVLILLLIVELLVRLLGILLRLELGVWLFDVFVFLLWGLDFFLWRAGIVPLVDPMRLSVAMISKSMRMMRIFRVMKRFKFLGGVNIVIEGAQRSASPAVVSFVMLGVYIFVFAIAMTFMIGYPAGHLADDYPPGMFDQFVTVPRSMETVGMTMLQGVHSSQYLTEPLLTSAPNGAVIVLVMLCFMFFGSFGLVALVNAIFQEIMYTTLKKHSQDKDKEEGTAFGEQDQYLASIFKSADKKDPRRLTWQEVITVLERTEEVRLEIEAMGLNIQMVRVCFVQLEDSSRTVDIEEFLNALAKLQNKSKGIDAVICAYQQYLCKESLQNLGHEIATQVRGMKAELRRLRDLGTSMAKHLRCCPNMLQDRFAKRPSNISQDAIDLGVDMSWTAGFERHTSFHLAGLNLVEEMANEKERQRKREKNEEISSRLAEEVMTAAREEYDNHHVQRREVKKHGKKKHGEHEDDYNDDDTTRFLGGPSTTDKENIKKVAPPKPTDELVHPAAREVRTRHLEPMLADWEKLLKAEGLERLRNELASAHTLAPQLKAKAEYEIRKALPRPVWVPKFGAKVEAGAEKVEERQEISGEEHLQKTPDPEILDVLAVSLQKAPEISADEKLEKAQDLSVRV